MERRLGSKRILEEVHLKFHMNMSVLCLLISVSNILERSETVEYMSRD